MSTPDISPIDCYKKKKAVSPLVPWPMDALTVDYIQIQFSKKNNESLPGNETGANVEIRSQDYNLLESPGCFQGISNVCWNS
jgi:hypothetical protein